MLFPTDQFYGWLILSLQRLQNALWFSMFTLSSVFSSEVKGWFIILAKKCVEIMSFYPLLQKDHTCILTVCLFKFKSLFMRTQSHWIRGYTNSTMRVPSSTRNKGWLKKSLRKWEADLRSWDTGLWWRIPRPPPHALHTAAMCKWGLGKWAASWIPWG